MESSPEKNHDLRRVSKMGYFRLYLQFIKIRLTSILSYRGSFFAGMIAQMLSYGAGFFTTWLLVTAFNELNGWTPYEVLLLYGMNLLSYALAAFFFYNFAQDIEELVIAGRLDGVLTKPVNPFFYLVCNGFNIAYFSHVTLALFTIIVSFKGLGIGLGPGMLLMFAVSILGAALIHAAAMIMTSVTGFWMLRVSFADLLYWNLRDFINYPLSIYNKIVQIILTFILPYALISFYPSQLFLGKEDYLFHPALTYATFPVGLCLFLLAYRFWQYGIDRYQGTGS